MAAETGRTHRAMRSMAHRTDVAKRAMSPVSPTSSGSTAVWIGWANTP